MTNGPVSATLPDKCCMCLGRSDLMHEVSTWGGESGRSIDWKFLVPLCRACLSRVKTRRIVAGLVGFGLAAAGGYAIWGTASSPATWSVWLGAVALPIGGLLLLAVAAGFLQPAMYLNGQVLFRNRQYQSLYEEANQARS